MWTSKSNKLLRRCEWALQSHIVNIVIHNFPDLGSIFHVFSYSYIYHNFFLPLLSLPLLTPAGLILNSLLSRLTLGAWPMSRCHIDLALRIFDPSQSVRSASQVGHVYLTPSGTLSSTVLHPVTRFNRAPLAVCSVYVLMGKSEGFHI